MTRIDPVTNRVAATISAGQSPNSIAVGEGAPWVENSVDHTVFRIEP